MSFIGESALIPYKFVFLKPINTPGILPGHVFNLLQILDNVVDNFQMYLNSFVCLLGIISNLNQNQALQTHIALYIKKNKNVL